ncbi:MAG: PIN domain-containing protein [Pirellulales bacterium]
MSTSRILIDTGPIVALLRRRDARHAVCDAAAKELTLPTYTCWPVITEAAYLLRQSPKVVRRLLACCDGTRFEILSLVRDDLPAIEAILADYQDQGFDLADAALMHLANREGIDTVFTLDRRHFAVFQGARTGGLRLVPDGV